MTLLDLLKQQHIPLSVCIFIDGLDEFDGDYDTVVKLINDLGDETHVKICLSSRPLRAFEDALSAKPGLRLQELTFGSVRTYAGQQLSNLIQGRIPSSNAAKDRVKDLLSRIVERGEGVFLWIVIAIRELRNGVQDIVDLDELERVIEDLPPQLEGLYTVMLQRVKPICIEKMPHDFSRSLPTDYHLRGTCLSIFANSTSSSRNKDQEIRHWSLGRFRRASSLKLVARYGRVCYHIRQAYWT